MNLDNSLEGMIHYFLFGRIIDLGYRDGVLMVSALMCTITHKIWPITSHDVRLSNSHDFTKLLHYIVSQLLKNIEFVPKLVVTLIYGWDPKVIIYSLWIESLLMEIGNNKYYQ